MSDYPKGWYWLVGERADAYSPAAAAYVSVSDPTYQAWLSSGLVPTRIASEAELGEVLHAWGIFDPNLDYTPAEVPMHKVEKAAKLSPWPGHASLYDAIMWAIGELPEPKRGMALTEFSRAANLVRLGATTSAVKALLGMTDEQRDELLRFAAGMP